MKRALRFRPDGTFTIVQFTDTHWHNGEPADLKTRALMERVLEAERPDLVVLTGDNLDGAGCRDPARAWRDLVAPMEERAIPWAAVFGNHDDEGALSREELLEVQQACAGCLSQRGPKGVSGVGNYVLLVESAKGGRRALVLYFLDSNSYAPPSVGGYAWIRHDQIVWYRETARALREENGALLPALAFFHIPLPEYEEVWATQPCRGHKNEPVCCPRLNTGFFAALWEEGDVMGTFVGHDHINDYEGTLYGIRLCYGRATGYQTYGREGFLRGARIIRCREGERDFRTWLRLEDGSIVLHPPLHQPQGVWEGRLKP